MSTTPTDEAAVLALRQRREAFVERVRENEGLAAADPEGYRRKLRRLVLMGYAYIGFVLALALGLTAGLVAILAMGHFGAGVVKIGIVLAVFLLAVLRSLWVKIERPGGLLVPRGRAPGLWREVEAIADRLGAPRPDEIRLDEEFNASAAQWPRFGIFGGYRSTLTLGLPLLAGLGPDEARGVIAHEFGHFSGKHGRFAVWIYRVNATWAQLGANLANSSGSFLFGPFVNWFSPRFAATSFALRRQHEYEADRAAAEIVGAPVVAGTLARLDALGEHQERVFWDPFRRAAERGGKPAHGFFGRMAEAVRQPLDESAARASLAFALAQPTDYDDSHPSLRDRLASLGADAPVAVEANPGPSAAEAFFGDALPGIVTDLERDYTARMEPVWSALEERRKAMSEALRALEAKPAPLSPSDAVERAFLRAALAEPEASLAIYRELLDAHPDNGHAMFLLGEALADRGDPEGADLLRRAVEREPAVADEARAALARHHARQGDHGEFSRLRDEAMEAYDRQVVAEEGSGFTLDDEALSPDLAPDERARLGTALGGLKGLARAYAVRKRLPGTGELRDYLFLVPTKTAFVTDDAGQYFMRQIVKGADLTREFTILTDPSPKPWEKKLEAVDGAKVFDHKAR